MDSPGFFPTRIGERASASHAHCRLVLPYNAVHSIQQTKQIPNDPPWMGRKVLLLAIIPVPPLV